MLFSVLFSMKGAEKTGVNKARRVNILGFMRYFSG